MLVIVGPADLSVSLGIPGEFEHPLLISAIESIMDTCSRRNIVPGIHVRVPKIAKDVARAGNASAELLE